MKISNMIDAGGLIEEGDWTLLKKLAWYDVLGLARVCEHQSGYIMYINPEGLSDRMDTLIDYGFSESLVEVYAEAVLNDCILINFDTAG